LDSSGDSSRPWRHWKVRLVDSAWADHPPRLLSLPLSAGERAYAFGLGLRRAARGLGLIRAEQVSPKVLSVGNIVSGGTGKTPFTVFLSRKLARRGYAVCILSHGYMRSGEKSGAVRVPDEPDLDWRAYGDEALLMKRLVPEARVYAGRDRLKAAREASRDGPVDVFIIDDGFQYWKMRKDVEILLLDSELPFGNGRLLPRGPLREDPEAAVGRADLLVMTRFEGKVQASSLTELAKGKPVVRCRYGTELASPGREGTGRPFGRGGGKRVVCFSGIAKPAFLEDNLRRLGLQIRKQFVFPDHHSYREQELHMIEEEAVRAGAEGIVTTDKDSLRLPGSWPARLPLMIASARIEPLEEDAAILGRVLDESGLAGKPDRG